MTHERCDTAIVGGGPAGATAARLLAAGGARVVLLERRHLPRYKTCGGGLIGRALHRLPPDLRWAAEHTCHEAEVHLADGGLGFRTRTAEPLVAMTMRAGFDAALLEAAAVAGASVRDGCRVEALEHTERGVRLLTSAGPLGAEILVAADGAHGRSARLAGWHAALPGVPALEGELRVAPAVHARFAGCARFDFGLPSDGYAWVFPKRDHLSVGILATRSSGRELKRLLPRYLERLALTGELELHGHSIPLRPHPEGAARGRVLLVGDAAGLADPLTAEGISMALASAELAARAVLRSGARPERAAGRYRRALRREVLPELRAARVLAGVLYGRPRLRRALFRRWGQSLTDAVGSVVAGRRTYRGLLRDPRNLARLLARAGDRHARS